MPIPQDYYQQVADLEKELKKQRDLKRRELQRNCTHEARIPIALSGAVSTDGSFVCLECGFSGLPHAS